MIVLVLRAGEENACADDEVSYASSSRGADERTLVGQRGDPPCSVLNNINPMTHPLNTDERTLVGQRGDPPCSVLYNINPMIHPLNTDERTLVGQRGDPLALC